MAQGLFQDREFQIFMCALDERHNTGARARRVLGCLTWPSPLWQHSRGLGRHFTALNNSALLRVSCARVTRADYRIPNNVSEAAIFLFCNPNVLDLGR